MSPTVEVRGPARDGRAVVLLLHGGREHGTRPARRGPAWARMVPFAVGAARATRGSGVAVWVLRYRVQGWNAPAEDPVIDARWALAEARRRHPGAPIVVVGHSMGGRVALRLAGDPDVAGVCALAPWIEPGEPVPAQPAPTLIIHGSRDHVTDPAAASSYAARTGARFVRVDGDGHTMLRHPLVWQRLVTGFVTAPRPRG
ncbi:alpha/beta hydrolase [Paractinoplanes ferrugineus]|uniref:Alpha/beta hydrolase n=1 Tax=Paractinoplanes ferrugineus TaxID=113564 RepID=A0A919J5D4_9ACTN|nr:alpha/beta fold hydrolase [Actinoplanes ferrugineus]GIE13318.1 alpha/beta hydrolase [Actinoplanes ferrugineus]